MMITSETSYGRALEISHVLNDISEAEEFRCDAINRLSDFYSASTAVFFNWAEAGGIPGNLRKEDIHFWRLDPVYQDIYFNNVFKDDPFRKWYRRFSVHPRVTTLSSIASPKELRKTPLYEQILCPNKQQDVLNICLVVNNRLLAHISLARHQGTADFGTKEKQIAELFSVTLSANYSRILLNQKFMAQKDIIGALTYLHGDDPCLITNESLELVFAGGDADTYFDNQGIDPAQLIKSLGTKLQPPANKHLYFTSDQNHVRYWDAGIIQCLRGNESGKNLECTFKHNVIEHRNGTYHILSLIKECSGIDALELTNLYGLTKREIQILDKISEGLDSTKIGEQLSISRWTVKNHLQSIYGKVGVNNRVSLLTKVAPFNFSRKY